MARIFITGSADGLGQLAAKALIEQGHEVVLHARNVARSKEALARTPGAETVLVADLSSMEETIALAQQVNALGRFDAVIHNAAVYRASGKELLAVNTLAPYLLTCLVQLPERLIYLSSGMHMSGSAKLDSFSKNINSITYSDTKLHVVMLCKAVARKRPMVYSNAVNPGRVPTKMGGAGAPDSLESGYQTQVWLATSNELQVKVSGQYFHHQQAVRCNAQANDIELQEGFLSVCKGITGVSFPT
jgi:NAD(P)-dependent dehydrogenase (short-subunit alcohol dehydrogenase family)